MDLHFQADSRSIQEYTPRARVDATFPTLP